MTNHRKRRGTGARNRCRSCSRLANGGNEMCSFCRPHSKRPNVRRDKARVYNTPVPRKSRQDVSHGYAVRAPVGGKRLGRPAGDEYSNIAAMPPSDEVFCPKCGEKMERRQLNRHRREIH